MDITVSNKSRNPATGRFNFVIGDDGDVSFDNTEGHAVVTSALEHLGKYWADSTHGSELYTLKNATSRTPSQAEAMVLAAEQPLVQANAIQPPTATGKIVRDRKGFNRLDIDLRWTTPTGDQQQQTVSV